MLTKELCALIQSNRMRKHSSNASKRDARASYQAMGDTHIRLSMDRKLKIYKMIIVLMHGTVQRVLDRNYSSIDLAVRKRQKHFFKSLARHYIHVSAKQL